MKSLVLALLLAACGNKSAPGPAAKPARNANELDTCKAPEDCTLVDACCGCNAGGKRVALRKDAVAEYDASRTQRCGDSMCTQMMSTHSSCDAEATCDAGHCKVMSHLGKQ